MIVRAAQDFTVQVLPRSQLLETKPAGLPPNGIPANGDGMSTTSTDGGADSANGEVLLGRGQILWRLYKVQRQMHTTEKTWLQMAMA